MTKVLLLNPPGEVIRTGRLVRRSKVGTQGWPPIFLAYAAGALEKAGAECRIIDASVMGYTEDETDAIIDAWKPDEVAYYWAYDTYRGDLDYANWLATKYRVTLVGPWSAHLPNALDLYQRIYAMTFGCFEKTLVRLYGGEKPRQIPGLKYREGDAVLFNPQGDPPTSAELDELPMVSEVYKRLLDVTKYHQTSLRYPFTDLFSGTPGSCYGRCTFCSWTNGMHLLHPKRWATRSLRSVMDELWFIKREMPEVKQVFFQDSTLPTPWGLKIADQMVEEKLDLCWGCYSRPDKTYEEIMRFKEAGCRTFHVGYECPDQVILDEIRKDTTVPQITRFAKDMRRAGMWQSMSLMIYPWMTEKQIKGMVKWAREMNPTRINVAQLQVYPNVPIAETVRAYADLPGKHLMGFEEMREWEQYCFREFYVRNPRFWLNVASNPGELAEVVKSGWGLLKFFLE